MEALKDISTRPLCTEKGCQTPARWRKMRRGTPTGIQLCEAHGPKKPERIKREYPGGLVWKRC